MFYGSSSFNGNLSGWNTASVQYMHCTQQLDLHSRMLRAFVMHAAVVEFGADMPLRPRRSVAMFYTASNFNGDLSSWNTANVTNMLCT